MNGGDTLALQYVNYTSYKYRIQFPYPVDWVQSEKLSSHDKGADISVSKLGKENDAGNGSLFWIVLENDLVTGSDLQAGLQHVMKMPNESNAPNKYEIIQPPTDRWLEPSSHIQGTDLEALNWKLSSNCGGLRWDL